VFEIVDGRIQIERTDPAYQLRANIRVPELLHVFGDVASMRLDDFLIQGMKAAGCLTSPLGRVMHQCMVLVGAHIDKELARRYYSPSDAVARIEAQPVNQPVQQPVQQAVQQPIQQAVQLPHSALVSLDWQTDDFSLRKYYMASRRVFDRPAFLSLSVDDARVGLRTRLFIAAALPNNTATFFSPQAFNVSTRVLGEDRQTIRQAGRQA
jgi:hypothetical protein